MDQRLGFRLLCALYVRFCKDFLRSRYRVCVTLSLLIVLQVGLAVPVPLLSAHLLDSVSSSRHNPSLLSVASFLILIALAQFLASFFARIVGLRLKENVIEDAEKRLIRQITRLPLTYFDTTQASYIQTRLSNDVRSLDGFLPQFVLPICLEGISYLIVIDILFLMAPSIALVALTGTMLFGLVFYLTSRHVDFLSNSLQETLATAAAVVTDSLMGIRTAKAYRAESELIQTADNEFLKLKHVQLQVGFQRELFGTTMTTIAQLTLLSLVIFAVHAVSSKQITMGQLLAVVMFLGLLLNPIGTLVESHLKIRTAAVAATRIYKLLAIAQERHAALATENSILAQRHPGTPVLKFFNVTFGYHPPASVLRNFDLDVFPGECIALVGSSGSGKTTAISLLLGFYEGYQGTILFDGTDITDIPLQELRQHIGLVDQSSHIFAGTILDNIRLGSRESTVEAVQSAAISASAHEFILDLPLGYNSIVGEGGTGLSAGQAQRIALARVFLKNPSVVVLDEAVSSVDSESETKIQHALTRLIHGRTGVIVAHRLSSLKLATRVLVLHDGQIVEDGTHTSLMRTSDMYCRLFQEQFAPLDRRKVFVARAAEGKDGHVPIVS